MQALQCGFEGVWGREDVLYRDRWTEVYAACDASPHCARMTLVADAGHWVQYEQADGFNHLLTKWAHRA